MMNIVRKRDVEHGTVHVCLAEDPFVTGVMRMRKSGIKFANNENEARFRSSPSGSSVFMYNLMFSYTQFTQYKTKGNCFLFSLTQNNQL